jgi:hypothetical protein
MTVRAEALAVEKLRDWLLMNLPAKVAAVNATRAPYLTCPYAGPFNVTSGMKLPVSTDGWATFTLVTLTTGAAQTATQVASDINGTAGLSGVASVDSAGRLVLAGTAPTSTVTSIAVGPDETGGNVLLGFNPGGERSVRIPLEAPLSSGVADGWPDLLDLGPGFWVIIGRRTSAPVNPGDIRRDEHTVGMELTLMVKETNIQNSRSREQISAVVQCVREVLLTDSGRSLGRAGFGDVQKLEERTVVIPGTPWRALSPVDGAEYGIFDVATMVVSVRVFERPAAS